MKQLRLLLVFAVAALFALAIGVAGGAAAKGTPPPPTGERAHGQSVLEPVFNAENEGQVGYVNTPNGTQHPVPSNPKSWSPIYVVEYPTGSKIDTGGSGAKGPLNCEHFNPTPTTPRPTDNCPSHGNDIAGLAQYCTVIPNAPPPCANRADIADVYSHGALGHDHVMDFHGGADWNVAWEPVIVLFTNAAAADHRLLTDKQIGDAVAAGDAIEIANPAATFHCSLVSDQVWSLTTAIPIG